MVKNFLAYDLAVELYKQCETINTSRHLKDQLDRASLSVVLNLAEGSGKPTRKEQLRFYSIAFGSLRETQTLLQLIRNEEAAATAHHLGGMLFKIVHRSGS